MKAVRRRVMELVRRGVTLVALLACALVVAAVPGAVVRPVVWLRMAPPLPPAPDRDAALDVVVLRARRDGAPIEGARVEVIAFVDGRAFLAGLGATARDGSAHVEGLPHGEVWLLADAVGFARGTSQLVLGAGARHVEMDLGEEHRLGVNVEDDRGAPIAGAEVEAAGAEPLPVGARADADGRALVGRLGAPPWIVTARAPGFDAVTRRGVREGEAVVVVLRKLGAIVVRVVGPNDAPVARAHVAIAGAALWPARAAETGDDGSVRIGALAAGAYALRASSGDLASPIELGATLARGEEKRVTLKLAPGRMVLVRVTQEGTSTRGGAASAEDDEPIAGARVALAEGGLSPFPLEASTGRDGRARLGPIAPGPASLAARADGFLARGAVSVEPSGGEVVIALVRAGTLTGRVVDARGFPIDGASVQIIGTDASGAPIDDDPRRSRFREAHFDATLAGPTPLVPSGELGVVPGPVPPIPHAFELPPAPAGSTASLDEPWVTRDDGTFRASPASPGRVRALVRHPQYVEALSDAVTLAPGSEAHVDVVMHAGGSLEGRVVDAAGRAVSGARVAVAAARGSMERATHAGADGSFAFASLADSVTLTAALDDESPAVTRVSVDIPEGGRRTVTLTLPEARAALEAHVKDDRGYAIETAQISAASLDPSVPLRLTAFTDAHGDAHLAGARGVALRVEVRAPGHASKIVETNASANELDIVLGAGETATGEVRSARGGDPIADAEVVLYTDFGAERARTDDSGAFLLKELGSGPARLRVRAPGYALSAKDVVIESTSPRPNALPRIELAVEGVVLGTVVDARGDPIAGARVAKDRVPTYLAVGATPFGIGVTDARGGFRLGELAEGTVTLEAFAPDVGRSRIDGVRVVAGRTTDEVKIILRATSDERTTEPASSGGVAVTLGELRGDPPEVALVAVAEGSEAERAGLAPGDTLVELDGAKVRTIADARARLSGPVGDDVVVRYRRGDRTDAVRVRREPVRR